MDQELETEVCQGTGEGTAEARLAGRSFGASEDFTTDASQHIGPRGRWAAPHPSVGGPPEEGELESGEEVEEEPAAGPLLGHADGGRRASPMPEAPPQGAEEGELFSEEEGGEERPDVARSAVIRQRVSPASGAIGAGAEEGEVESGEEIEEPSPGLFHLRSALGRQVSPASAGPRVGAEEGEVASDEEAEDGEWMSATEDENPAPLRRRQAAPHWQR